MKKVELSKLGPSRGKYFAIVDNEDFKTVNKFNWTLLNNGNCYYAYRTIVNSDGKRTSQLMHVLIMGQKGIDHADRNGLNNQKNNLRFSTQLENTRNRSKRQNTSSKYKGVCFFKKDKKYFSQITLNKKNIYLGSFDNEIDAAKAYNKKAIELFGEFACLNKF